MFRDEGEQHDDVGEKLIAPDNFDGPVQRRRCTDVLFTLLLLGVWIVMTGIGIHALQDGDYRGIVYPMDYDGNVCGLNNNHTRNRHGGDVTGGGQDMTDYPYLLFVNTFGGGICVDQCPNLTGLTQDNLTDTRTLVTYGGIWQAEGSQLSKNFINVPNYSDFAFDSIECTENSCYPDNSTVASWHSRGINGGYGYAYYVGETFELLNRCYLTQRARNQMKESIMSDYTTKTIATRVGGFWNSFWVNVIQSWRYVLMFGLGISTLISFLYVFLLRLPLLLSATIWTSIFATIGMFAAAGYLALSTAAEYAITQYDNETLLDPNIGDIVVEPTSITSIIIPNITAIVPNIAIDNDETMIRYMRVGGYISISIAALLLLIACCLCKQIMLAITCAKQAARAINQMPMMLILPFLQVIGLCCFITVWCTYAVHLASLATIHKREIPVGVLGQSGTEISVRTIHFEDNEYVYYGGWFLLFAFYWTANFITAVGDTTIAMCIAKWYFTRAHRRAEEFGSLSGCCHSALSFLGCGCKTIFRSICTTLYYHTGTCALGSLLISILQLIRTIIAKIQRSIEYQLSLDATSSIVRRFLRCILGCLQCFFGCLERCLRFISKNAYIQTAIFGSNFCTSSRRAFFLILRNADRMAGVTYVAGGILIIGKLFISTITTGIAYFYVMEVDEEINELHNFSAPLVVIFILSYIISGMFMDIFDMSINTILHCFIADEEMFGDSNQPTFADDIVKRWVGSNSNDNGNNNRV